MKTTIEIKERLIELDKLMWARAVTLAYLLKSYDMDEEYSALLAEEKELEELLKGEEK